MALLGGESYRVYQTLPHATYAACDCAGTHSHSVGVLRAPPAVSAALFLCRPPLREFRRLRRAGLRGRARDTPRPLFHAQWRLRASSGAFGPNSDCLFSRLGVHCHRFCQVRLQVVQQNRTSSLWPPSIPVIPLTSRSSFVERQDVPWVHVVQALPLFNQLFRIREKEADGGALAIQTWPSGWLPPTGAGAPLGCG